MFWVYVIRSDTTGRIYIGQTNNYIKRLKRHNQEIKSKQGSFTKLNKGPWKLVYRESYNTRADVLKREKELKTFRGRKFIKKLINN